MPDFDQDLIEEGLALLRKKLGEDIFGKITIVYQSQVLFLMDIIHYLERAHKNKNLRRWFVSKLDDLDGMAPIDLMHGEWNPEDPNLVSVRALAESAEEKD